ncbi:unnamed protein product [Phytophthora fragariaefolia]|uniref:Unnamed protein product n=1 Tax=Phytophthora fragariaefolia TaxID=1490495 RepID=A0A9W6U4V0_9STRA|nr:unnamed protein product [Phytophthora fragariaefolia]
MATDVKASGLASAQQQLDELECMLSMFPDDEELTVDMQAKAALEMEKLNSELLDLTTASCAAEEVAGLQLYQQMHDFLSEVQVTLAENNPIDEASVPPAVSGPVVLGRRAIYFHHIIASNKRRVVKEWALELQLSGFSKIGWPGVVIVEGAEPDVQEYVRRLQHLRWKQITVRGEQTEEGVVDDLRRLPRGFREFPEDGMSDLAAACRDAGLEELFLTTMKIYGRSDELADSDHSNGSGTSKRKG